MKYRTPFRLIGHAGCLLAAFGLGHYLPVMSQPFMANSFMANFGTFLFHSLAFGGAVIVLLAPWSRVQLGDNRAIDAQRLINATLWLFGYYAGFGWLILQFAGLGER